MRKREGLGVLWVLTIHTLNVPLVCVLGCLGDCLGDEAMSSKCILTIFTSETDTSWGEWSFTLCFTSEETEAQRRRND